jgi:hypothetical protein
MTHHPISQLNHWVESSDSSSSLELYSGGDLRSNIEFVFLRIRN